MSVPRQPHSLELAHSPSEQIPGVIAPIEAELARVGAWVSGDELGPYTIRHRAGEAKVASGTIDWSKNLAAPREKLMAVAADVILQDPEEGEEERTRELFVKHLGTPTEDGELKFMPIAALAAAEKVRSLRRFAETTIGVLDIENMPQDQQFELMKLLSATTLNESSVTNENLNRFSLQLVYVFSAADHRTRTPLNFTEKVESGEFDTAIAKELLFEASEDYTSPPDNGRLEIIRLLSLGQLMLGSETAGEAIEGLSSEGALPLWNSGALATLATRKAQYVAGLRQVKAHCQSAMTDYRCMPVKSTEEDLQRLSLDLLTSIADQKSRSSRASMKQRILAQQIINGPSAKRRSTANPGSQAVAKKEETNKPIEPRKLFYVSTQGEKIPEEDAEFKKLLDGYADDHVGQKGLEEDIINIKDYLKNLDLSGGLPRGVKKMHGASNVRVGDLRFKKVHQLSVSDAVGLPTRSERGEKIRVLFSIHNGDLLIIAIEDKKNVDKLQKKLGFDIRAKSSRQ